MAVFLWKKVKNMKNNNVKQFIETSLIAVACSALVLSLNKSCSNNTPKDNTKQKIEQVQDSLCQKTR